MNDPVDYGQQALVVVILGILIAGGLLAAIWGNIALTVWFAAVQIIVAKKLP